MSRPLAEVVPMVTVAGGYGGIRIGGAKGPTWGVNGGLFDRSHDPPAAAVAESLAHDINAAHFAVVSQLRGQLAVMRQAFDLARPTCVACGEPGTRHFTTEGDGPFWLCDSTDASHGEEFYLGDDETRPFDSLADLDTGEWVPREKYRQLELVLKDALEERRDVWRERCERAREMLNMVGALWLTESGSTLRPKLVAILEGREPAPTTTDGPRWASTVINYSGRPGGDDP